MADVEASAPYFKFALARVPMQKFSSHQGFIHCTYGGGFVIDRDYAPEPLLSSGPGWKSRALGKADRHSVYPLHSGNLALGVLRSTTWTPCLDGIRVPRMVLAVGLFVGSHAHVKKNGSSLELGLEACGYKEFAMESHLACPKTQSFPFSIIHPKQDLGDLVAIAFDLKPYRCGWVIDGLSCNTRSSRPRCCKPFKSCSRYQRYPKAYMPVGFLR
ncbi:hypothetical protein HD554DRAFT_2039982 [Boletus coccyginus]|nr:hypothetical protein HD554DRAFT_2039982 [Boletus coccyginus]